MPGKTRSRAATRASCNPRACRESRAARPPALSPAADAPDSAACQAAASSSAPRRYAPLHRRWRIPAAPLRRSRTPSEPAARPPPNAERFVSWTPIVAESVSAVRPWRRLPVKEVLFANLREGLQRVLEALLDDAGVLAGGEAAHDVVAADQRAARGEIDLAGIEMLQRSGELETEPGGVEHIAVGDHEAHALDFDPFEVRRRGGEAGGIHTNSWNVAAVEIGCQIAAHDEVRAHLLEGGIGAAAHGEVARVLDHAQAGIQRGRVEAAHVARGIDPGQAGGVEPVAAVPVLHRNHIQRRVDFQLSVEH